jgi:hypothetical protein
LQTKVLLCFTSRCQEIKNGRAIILTEYDKLLEDARAKAEAFKSTAKEYIPKMYRALNENPNLKPEDARDRIEKDCISIWSKRTILDALPDEAKDLEKQKAGRLSQKEANSAAVSAAPEKKKQEEIMIDTQGKPIENATTQPLTTTKATVAHSFQTCDNSEDQLQNKDNLLHFEFFIPSIDVQYYIFTPTDEGGNIEDKDQFWINGVLDKRTGKVIYANPGRRSQPE